jgi:hypothetical protein
LAHTTVRVLFVPVCMIMGPGNGRFFQAQGTT